MNWELVLNVVIKMKRIEVRNEDYVTELYSYDVDGSRVMSRVSVKCKNYNTFCKVVEAVQTALEQEES